MKKPSLSIAGNWVHSTTTKGWLWKQITIKILGCNPTKYKPFRLVVSMVLQEMIMDKQPTSRSTRELSQDTCPELIPTDLLGHIAKGMGGKLSGDNITKIICPKCGKPEAWTKVADPSTIHCNRKNNCGASTHAKTFAPHLWGNWSERFSPTKEDPHRTARIYLRSRRLDTSNPKNVKAYVFRYELEQKEKKVEPPE